MPETVFAETRFGRERLAAGSVKRRHRHARGYVAVVLAGSYIEAGDEGRRRLGPGDALVHREFDGHLDLIGRGGADVLNLPLPANRSLPIGVRVADPDAVARAAEADPAAASALLDTAEGTAPLEDDWPDILAAALRIRSDLRITDWAAAMGLAPATVSRGFRCVFGLSPARYRAEMRARRAFVALTAGMLPLAELALASGFADQAHLSRAIADLTGAPPSAWRRTSNSFKTTGMRPN
ncbi:MAG: AraC family transcriptional regulator [Casimicrobiaceae bacterium]